MKMPFSNYKRLYKELFSTHEGKQVLHDLAYRFYMTNPTVRKGDSEMDFFVREGSRQVILYILSQTNYDIEKYLQERDKYKLEVTHD